MASGPERDPPGPRRDGPTPKPPSPPRRSTTASKPTGEDFVVTAIKFRPKGDGAAIFGVSIKRNLPIATKAVEFQVQLAAKSDGGAFGYHGGEVWKGGNEAQAAQPTFKFPVAARFIYTRDGNGTITPPGPPSQTLPVWVQVLWKDSEGKLHMGTVQQVKATVSTAADED